MVGCEGEHVRSRESVWWATNSQHGMKAICLRPCLHPLVHFPLSRMPPRHTSLTNTRLRREIHLRHDSSVTGVGGQGRQLHRARETAFRGASVDVQSKWKVCELVQLAAGLYRAAPAASDPPFARPCRTPERALMYTRLERVHATTSTRRGRGKTVKPVFIKIRTASSMELIASAQAE